VTGRDLTCRAAAALVTDLVEDALTADQRLDLELHMVVCEGCDAMVRQMRTTIEVLRALPPEPVPAEEELLASILGRVGPRPEPAG
jgi:hypothetical protein